MISNDVFNRMRKLSNFRYDVVKLVVRLYVWFGIVFYSKHHHHIIINSVPCVWRGREDRNAATDVTSRTNSPEKAR